MYSTLRWTAFGIKVHLSVCKWCAYKLIWLAILVQKHSLDVSTACIILHSTGYADQS